MFTEHTDWGLEVAGRNNSSLQLHIIYGLCLYFNN